MFHVPDAYSIVIPTCECNTYWPRYPIRCVYLFPFLHAYLCDAQVSQAFSGITTDLDVLVDLLESVENFLNRLIIYTKVPRTPALTEIVEKIMVELLHILALATKQIRQGRPSESIFAD